VFRSRGPKKSVKLGSLEDPRITLPRERSFAIIALKEAHNADPYDLDTLLALGVSCTNENDRTKAYEHLHLWLKYHPDFNHLPGVQETTDPEYDMIRRIFEEAHVLKPQDTQVLLALGVLSFIQTNFELAGAYF
jgi:peroxin-5